MRDFMTKTSILKFRRKLGALQQQARCEPVEITRHGRRAFVLMSHHDWMQAAGRRTYRTSDAAGIMTREIVTNVGQAASGTAEVAANISDVSGGFIQTGAASTQVLQSARSLSSESAHLKTTVEKFLDNVRAA
jgi:prevent-host-death family protein